MRLSLQIGAIFIAVGLGALSVTLLHDPMALIPRPPYGRWILVRLLLLGTLAALGILLVFGVVDDRTDIDDTDGSFDRAIFWRVVGSLSLLVHSPVQLSSPSRRWWITLTALLRISLGRHVQT